jgi:hypothetical protein
LVFATSAAGGTGRTVVCCNVAYRRAMSGDDVCYLDFDLGSPAAAGVLHAGELAGDAPAAGVHSYLRGEIAEPKQLDVWSRDSERNGLRVRPPGAGRLALVPGDPAGGEFASTPEVVQRCRALLLKLEEEYELCLVDLSAGRSHALDMVLTATASSEFRSVVCRWVVFHRWTRQHIDATATYAFGDRGIVATGVARGHDRRVLGQAIRFVRTGVVDRGSAELAGLRPPQLAWLHDRRDGLQRLASKLGLGPTVLLSEVSPDPVLQWHEQLITDNDVWERAIANRQTVDSFVTLADRLVADEVWEGM